MSLKPGLFSIIVPVKAYNAYCAESLGRCAELYPDQEILFSPDEATEVPFAGVKVIPSGPQPPSAKRDLCMEQATGEILAFLDDDAFPEPGWLEAAAELFADPAVAAVGGPAVTPDDDSVARHASGLVYQSWLVGGPHAFRYIPLPARKVDDYPTCNLLVRKDVMQAIGGFDTGYWPGEDTVACLKIVHELKRTMLYDPRVLVRHHRRDMFLGHLRQVRSYALHRGYFVKRFPQTSLRASYFLPSLLLLGSALGWIPGLWWPQWGRLWAAGLGLYALLCVAQAGVSMAQAPRSRRGLGLWMKVFLGLPWTHYAYGAYFLVGLLSPRLGEERASLQGLGKSAS